MPRMVLFGDKFGMLWNLSIYLGTLLELRIICWHIISIAKSQTIIRILTLYLFVLYDSLFFSSHFCLTYIMPKRYL